MYSVPRSQARRRAIGRIRRSSGTCPVRRRLGSIESATVHWLPDGWAHPHGPSGWRATSCRGWLQRIAEVLSRITCTGTLHIPSTCTGSSSLGRASTSSSPWPCSQYLAWSSSRQHCKVLGTATSTVLQPLEVPSTLSLHRSRQERPAHLLAGSLDPYSHSCASHSPKLISLRHLHHPKGQRDSQNSHHRCWLSASAAPLALTSNRPLWLYNTNAPALFVSYMYVSPAACALLLFVLVGTWRHVPCSNCA